MPLGANKQLVSDDPWRRFWSIVFCYTLLQHLKGCRDPVMDGVLEETEAMLARGGMDMPIGPCFAANRDDDLLLHHLLKRKSDPNEADKNGRTALVRRFVSFIYVYAYTYIHALMHKYMHQMYSENLQIYCLL